MGDIFSIVVSGLLVLASSSVTYILQHTLQRRREISLRAIDRRSQIYGELNSRLFPILSISSQYTTDETNGKAVRIKKKEELEKEGYQGWSFVGPYWNDTKKNLVLDSLRQTIGEAILYASSELRQLLEELDDILDSHIFMQSWDKILTSETEGDGVGILMDISDSVLKLREIREKILISMRKELLIV